MGRGVCTLWIALDDCSGEDSGTLEYVAGSHRWPVPYDDLVEEDTEF